jgi:hypothetical protein
LSAWARAGPARRASDRNAGRERMSHSRAAEGVRVLPVQRTRGFGDAGSGPAPQVAAARHGPPHAHRRHTGCLPAGRVTSFLAVSNRLISAHCTRATVLPPEFWDLFWMRQNATFSDTQQSARAARPPFCHIQEFRERGNQVRPLPVSNYGRHP